MPRAWAALALAWTGTGYRALIVQELLYSAVYACAVWTVCRWRPGRPVRDSGVGPMIGLASICHSKPP